MSPDGYSVAEKRLLQAGETHAFQAEVSRLMSLIVNSIYSNKEIFLRELISNASDALDKIRFLSLTNPQQLESNPNLEIRIKPIPDQGIIQIIDTGVGMTKQELITNLGTIAKSGTSEFITNSGESADTTSLIGQFGVGFYSSFLVAERVTVQSKSNNDSQHIWTSDSNGVFVVGDDSDGEQISRGTVISLHLREDQKQFLDQDTLRELVSKYSEFINFPIYLYASHTEEHEIVVEEDENEEADIESDEEEDEDEEDDEPLTETITETVWEWELLNDVKPLWTRDPSEITDEEYINFYKSAISKKEDVEDPYSWTHFNAEGELEFRAILYIPREVPENMFNSARNHDLRGVKLYVRRVYITDEFDTIIPKYLSFVKGIIDSNSLPLNVSREILQQDKSLKQMEKKLVRKAIAMIQKLAQDDEEAYLEFYDDYRVNLKLGILDDRANQDRLARLLRFHSSKSGSELVTLEQYIENMKEDQDKIYFIAGESKEVLANSPLLERLIDLDYEVLYFTDSIDEFWTQAFSTFDGKQLVNIAKDGNLGLEDKEEEEEKVGEDEFKPLLDFLKSTLGSKVSKAILSSRLTSTPAALISGAHSYSANMERIQKAQALGGGIDPFMMSKKILEINPKHPIIQHLRELVDSNSEDEAARDIAEILFDTAALSSGFSLEDPAIFTRRIHRILSTNLENAVYQTNEQTEEVEEESNHSHEEL
jgi:heat shock protein beta